MLPKSLYSFVWLHGRRQQLVLIAITLLSFPLAYAALEIPKVIIDDAIGGETFPVELLGLALGQIDFLIFLCGAFFVVFCLSNLVKYHLNILRGLSGETLLRRMRYTMVDHVLRLRPGHDRRYSPGEMVQTVVGELQPIGGFVGDAFAVPLLQLGMLCVYVVFIFVQDAALGALSILIIPVQAYIVPRMQRRVVELNHKRILNARDLSDQIAETVASLPSLRRHHSLDWRRVTISEGLQTNYELRYAIFRQKFLIKFVNNVLNQLMPFVFYMFGGYLVITGDLEIGALVTVIAAYRDLSTPWRELLKHYETHADITSRYSALVERIAGAPLEPEAAPGARARAATPDAQATLCFGPLARRGAPFVAEKVEAAAGATVAIKGGDAVLRGDLMARLAGEASETTGAVALSGADPARLSNLERSEFIGFVEREPFLVSGALRDNLALELLRPQPFDAEEAPEKALRDTLESGNFAVAPDAPLFDFARAGVADLAALDQRLLALADAVGALRRIFELGLGAPADPDRDPALAEALVEMRRALRAAPERETIANDVEFWRRDRFNANASVLENLLFAAPITSPAAQARLSETPSLARRLSRSEILPVLLDMGAEIVEATADLIEKQRVGSPLLQNFDLYPPEEVAARRVAARRWRRVSATRSRQRAALERVGRRMRVNLVRLYDAALRRSPTSRASRRLASVALRFTPARHRLGALTRARRDAVLAGRAEFSDFARTDATTTRHFAPIDRDACVPRLSIRENALLGKPRANRRDQAGRIDERLWELARASGVVEAIARAGLERRLQGRTQAFSLEDRRRFGVVRALVARPRLLLLDGLTGGASADDRALVASIQRVKGDSILILSVEDVSDEGMDGVLDLESGAYRRLGAAVGPPQRRASPKKKRRRR